MLARYRNLCTLQVGITAVTSFRLSISPVVAVIFGLYGAYHEAWRRHFSVTKRDVIKQNYFSIIYKHKYRIVLTSNEIMNWCSSANQNLFFHKFKGYIKYTKHN